MLAFDGEKQAVEQEQMVSNGEGGQKHQIPNSSGAEPQQTPPVGLTQEDVDRVNKILKKVDDARIPGEGHGWSVYKVTFEDGCTYHGHTTNVIAWKVEHLCEPEHRDAIPYMVMHNQRMSKTLECLATDLDSGGQALAIRNRFLEGAHEETDTGGPGPEAQCDIRQHLEDRQRGIMLGFHERMAKRRNQLQPGRRRPAAE